MRKWTKSFQRKFVEMQDLFLTDSSSFLPESFYVLPRFVWTDQGNILLKATSQKIILNSKLPTLFYKKLCFV